MSSLALAESTYVDIRLPVILLDSIPRNGGKHPYATLEDSSPNAEQLLFEAQAATEIRAFVESLPPRQRQIIELIYWDGFGPSEASRLLGISPAAITNALKAVFTKGQINLRHLKNTSLQ
jgi:RNA polymerase sigma factor (sigma-70 family)